MSFEFVSFNILDQTIIVLSDILKFPVPFTGRRFSPLVQFKDGSIDNISLSVFSSLVSDDPHASRKNSDINKKKILYKKMFIKTPLQFQPTSTSQKHIEGSLV